MIRHNLKLPTVIFAVIWAMIFFFSAATYTEAAQTEKIVVVARHNIRGALGGKELDELTPHKWLVGRTKPGYLSPRGALAESLLGQYFRTALVDEGLFKENYIPQKDEVRFYANSFQRTVATARYFAAGMLPMADVQIEHHYGINESDPVFVPGKIKLEGVTKQKADDEAAKIGGGKKWGERFAEGANVTAKALDFPVSDFAREKKVTTFSPYDLTLTLDDGIHYHGMMQNAKRASDAMMMQYYETGGSDEASFGHKLTRQEWHKIADLQYMGISLYYELPTLSREMARPLLNVVSQELNTAPRKFTFLCGHDTNIATVLVALGVEDYDLPRSLESKTPLGSLIVIKKIIGDNGQAYADISLVYQSTEQMLNLQTLDKDNPPVTYKLNFKGLHRGDNGLFTYDDVVKHINAAAK